MRFENRAREYAQDAHENNDHRANIDDDDNDNDADSHENNHSHDHGDSDDIA